MERKEIEFPQVISIVVLWDLQRIVEAEKVFFYFKLKPVLKKHGLLSDENIKKYLSGESMQLVYEDAMAHDAERVRLLEDVALSCNVDFWEPFRADGCKVKSPKEENFVFARMPLADCPLWQRNRVLRILVVEDGQIFASDEAIRKESIIPLTEKDKEIFGIVQNFCNEINELFSGSLQQIIYKDSRGKFQPNAKGILRLGHPLCF